MTDEPIDHLPDGTPLVAKEQPQGIELDRYGDPIAQGVRMTERDSYERIIEGMKIASDAAMHLAKHETVNGYAWTTIGQNLDQCRRICVQKAGLGLTMKEKETQAVRGEPMGWMQARKRIREGLVQAAGGLRQLATCHRLEMWWSTMATQIESMEQKIRSPKRSANRGGGLILPPSYH